MKWSLIIPIAFIAGIVMFGCTSEEEGTAYQPEPGETAIEGEEGAEGATTIGTPMIEPL